MRSLRPPTRGDADAFLPTLLANLLPLLGVVALEWNPATLVVVYGLEVLLSLVVAAGQALFAQRSPPENPDGVLTISEAHLSDKRGSVRPIERLPPIYPRNVPFALGVSTLVAMYMLFFGALLTAIVDAPAELARPDVPLSVVALVGGHLAETKREYFDERGYERVSPYAVIETPARQLFVVLIAIVPLGLALGSTAALALVVGAKLLVEWSSHRASRDESDGNRFVDRFVGWFAGPTDAAAREEPVDAPSSPPAVRVRPDRTAVVLEGAFLGCWRLAGYLPFAGIVWFVALLTVVAWLDSPLVFWVGVAGFLAALAALAAIQFVRYYLAVGTLEYQRRDDHLVAYDRLVEEPQWAVPIDHLRNVAVVNDRFVDRLLGTRTIRVATGWGARERERRLGPVADPDRLVEGFDLPLSTTDLEPLDRRLAGAAVVLAVGIALTTVAVFVAGASLEARVDALWIAPAAMALPWWLWKRACPDPE